MDKKEYISCLEAIIETWMEMKSKDTDHIDTNDFMLATLYDVIRSNKDKSLETVKNLIDKKVNDLQKEAEEQNKEEDEDDIHET